MEHALGASLDRNRAWLRDTLGRSGDVKLRDLKVPGDRAARQALVVYIEGLAEGRMLQEAALEPLLRSAAGAGDLASLADQTVQTPGATRTTDPDHALNLLLRGHSLLFIDGQAGALILDTLGYELRSPDEPPSEPSVRGPREGFIESLVVNRSMIRRRLVDASLRFLTLEIGQESRTMVNVAYLEGRAPAGLVREVFRRLKRVDTAGIEDPGMLQGWIEDSPWSPFPQIDHTQRPDKVAAALLAGRVGILVDGAPGVLLMPTVFWHFMHVPEDYYERWWATSLIRVIRAVSVFLSLTLPGLWVTLVSFHHELLPTALALSVAAGRERVPLPVVVEALMLEVTFEILREAGLRLPRPVGQAVSIIGGLVIGEAAVAAGLVSPDLVIVVALTGLASFSTPSFSAALTFRVLRFFVLVLSGTFGVLGFGFAVTLTLLHMVGLKSFGVPYLSPVLPYIPRSVGDTLIRPPWRRLRSQHSRWWRR